MNIKCYLKHIATALVVLTSLNLSAQSQPDTVFTSQQVLRINYVIDSLQYEVLNLQRKDKASSLLIQQYENSNKELKDLLQDYRNYQQVNNQQVTVLQQSLDRYNELLAQKYKKSFWDKPITYFIAGAGLIYLSSKIVANVK